MRVTLWGMFVALDIGGTSMRVACVRNLGRVKIAEKGMRMLRTKNRYQEDLKALIEAIRLVAPGRVRGIGVSVAGRIDRQKGKVIHSPNIKSWNNKPLAGDLSRAFGCPVVVENDAACAAIGEAVYGKVQGDFFFLIWGTGIGGTHVAHVGKSLVVSPSEPGHQMIPVDGRAEVFERVSGGAGIKRRFGKWPSALTNNEWGSVLDGMEVGIANLLMIRPVRTMVFGGGGSIRYPQKVRALHAHLKKAQKRYPMMRLAAFRVSSLGECAGLYGAFARLKLGKKIIFL